MIKVNQKGHLSIWVGIIRNNNNNNKKKMLLYIAKHVVEYYVIRLRVGQFMAKINAASVARTQYLQITKESSV